MLAPNKGRKLLFPDSGAKWFPTRVHMLMFISSKNGTFPSLPKWVKMASYYFFPDSEAKWFLTRCHMSKFQINSKNGGYGWKPSLAWHAMLCTISVMMYGKWQFHSAWPANDNIQGYHFGDEIKPKVENISTDIAIYRPTSTQKSTFFDIHRPKSTQKSTFFDIYRRKSSQKSTFFDIYRQISTKIGADIDIFRHISAYFDKYRHPISTFF